MLTWLYQGQITIHLQRILYLNLFVTFHLKWYFLHNEPCMLHHNYFRKRKKMPFQVCKYSPVVLRN